MDHPFTRHVIFGKRSSDYAMANFFPGVVLIIIVAVLLSLSLAKYARASSATEATKHKLETNIQKYKINIGQLQEGIKLQQNELKKSKGQEKDLLAQLQDIDTRLGEQREKLNVLKEKMAAQQDLIGVKEKELDRVKKQKNTEQQHLLKRLSAYYKMGKIGLINVIFSAHTLPQLLSFHDSFQTLIQYDQHLIDTYRQSIDQLERMKRALALEESLLQEFIGREEKEENRIDAIKQQKENLLTLIRTQEQLHQQAIKEMTTAWSNLNSTVAAMEKKVHILDQGFLLNRGKLPPPVDGTVVTLFGQEKTNRLGITYKSNGIAIKAPDGTEVRAIYDGIVIYSGYVRGYGNTIIVDHGYQYYSIISRVEKLLKKSGDKVKTGDIIAVMGDTATLIDEGLYLEIRHGNTSLDPLQWLDKDKLTIEANETQPSPGAQSIVNPIK